MLENVRKIDPLHVYALYKCNVCGNEFELNIDNHYVAKDDGVTGISTVVKKEEEKLYDTYDCPICGCQNLIQNRKRRLFFDGVLNDENELEDEELDDYDEIIEEIKANQENDGE